MKDDLKLLSFPEPPSFRDRLLSIMFSTRDLKDEQECINVMIFIMHQIFEVNPTLDSHKAAVLLLDLEQCFNDYYERAEENGD